MKSILKILLIPLLTHSCYSEELGQSDSNEYELPEIIKFDQVYAALDDQSNTLYLSISADTINNYNPKIKHTDSLQFFFEGKALTEGQVNELGCVYTGVEYNLLRQSRDRQDSFRLVFTTNPILQILTNEKIPNEPKILSKIYLQDPTVSGALFYEFESYAGIEIRGNYNTKFDKKPYGIELWEDANREDLALSLIHMRASPDWVLDAMYVDMLRIRNKLANQIWKSINIDYVDFNYIEVILNNSYIGLYCLGEKLNKELLSQNHQAELLYKGIGNEGFNALEFAKPEKNFVWEGWEQVYPENDTSWHKLYRFRKFLTEASDSLFAADLHSYINIDNLIDVYLFINLISAYDNIGKNVFIAKYKDKDELYLQLWDMDWTFGTLWPGMRIGTTSLINNYLFRRTVELNAANFNELLTFRWNELRESVLRKEVIISQLEANYYQLKNNGSYTREFKRWNDSIPDIDEEFAYISTWINNRLIFLDSYFQ
jgi:spore coat protein H